MFSYLDLQFLILYDRNNKTVIKANEKYEIKSEGKKYTLVINDVNYDDEAKFTCDVEGCRSTAKLAVAGKTIKQSR